MLGSIEAGGTKIVCAVAEVGQLPEFTARVVFDTKTPEENFAEIRDFFTQYELDALGVGSFGPIDIDETSNTYGYITTTPKPHWGNVDFVGALREWASCPTFWTTDVNAAAYGELHYGIAKGLRHCLYMTVGTGVGGGVVIDGKIMNGKGHPEVGHIFVQKDPNDTFKGNCPYHHDCLEGLVSGPAIQARTGVKGSELAVDDPVWELVADYLAQACVNYTLCFVPERIIFGGGVMKQPRLLPLIREKFVERMNGYMEVGSIEDYIVPCGLGDHSGIVGGFALAESLLQ